MRHQPTNKTSAQKKTISKVSVSAASKEVPKFTSAHLDRVKTGASVSGTMPSIFGAGASKTGDQQNDQKTVLAMNPTMVCHPCQLTMLTSHKEMRRGGRPQ